MPELPEVEVTRLSFAQRIEGARVQGVYMGRPLRWPLGVDAPSLVGLQVLSVSRRGKYLWLQLTQGGLLMHFSGNTKKLTHGIAKRFTITVQKAVKKHLGVNYEWGTDEQGPYVDTSMKKYKEDIWKSYEKIQC